VSALTLPRGWRRRLTCSCTDSPGYEVFCAGLTTVAIALVLTWWFNLQFQRRLVARELQERMDDAQDKEKSSLDLVARLADSSAALGIASAAGLPVLSFFSTTSYPDVHQYSAYWFFVLEAGAVVINVSACLTRGRCGCWWRANSSG
jgi:uncharacterized protein YjeT (DUF2065 family)